MSQVVKVRLVPNLAGETKKNIAILRDTRKSRAAAQGIGG